MKQISGILLSSHWASGSGGHGHRLLYWCPGCKELHGIEVDQSNKPSWKWNGDAEKPTFEPSVLHFTADPDSHDVECHYFVRDGLIDFCGDSPHELRGKRVPIPPLPEEWRRP